MTTSPTEFIYSAFISYASADRRKAEEICTSLEEKGLRCWIAPRDVRAGGEYGEEIIRGIEQSRCLVLVLSEAANESAFVRREVERAVSKKRPVFPIRVEDVLPSPSLELFVASTHWIDAWMGDLVSHMDRLARALTDESSIESAVKHSRRIARRRQVPKWIGVTVVFAGIVLAIVTGNVLSSRIAPEAAPIVESAPPPLDVDSALGRLDRAIGAADLSNRGQVEAMETLLSAGQSYAGATLRGIHLGGVKLSGHSFADTDFSGSNLAEAQLEGAKLEGARLRFVIADSARADEAQARGIRALFLTAEASSWRQADCRQAIFFGSRLRGADFSGVDLRGADLTFCDLRDTNFENAKLEGAFFIGSVLAGARFDGAQFGNTDMTAAAIDMAKLTPEQRAGMGRTETFRGEYLTLNVSVIEEIPTSRFSGGIEYRPLVERPWSLPGFGDESLPLCEHRTLLPSESWPLLQIQGSERISDLIGTSFDHDFLQISNRRREFLARIAAQEAFLMDHLAAK